MYIGIRLRRKQHLIKVCMRHAVHQYSAKQQTPFFYFEYVGIKIELPKQNEKSSVSQLFSAVFRWNLAAYSVFFLKQEQENVF